MSSPLPRYLSTTVVTALLFAGPVLNASAVAEEAQAPAPAAPAPSPEPSKVDVSGFVDVYYGYNFNEAGPGLRTFDVQHNAVSLSLAEVSFTKAVSLESRVGFRADLDFGKTAVLVSAYEPENGGKEIYEHIQQAYLSLLTGRVQWDAGKFVTPMGAEVIESQDNWNYSRSILFGYAIPFYHVGVRATLPVNDEVSVGAQLVNGWNNSSETNGGKTLHLSATVKPTASLTWVANYMMGREAPDTTPVRDVRNLLDTTLTLAATAKLSLMVNVDYGKEGPVAWWGVATYGKYQVLPSWVVAARYEYVDDTKGGFMTIGTRAQSLTMTSDHLLAGALRARFEYRLDLTDGDFFKKSDGSLTDSLSMVTVGLVYGFSGKI